MDSKNKTVGKNRKRVGDNGTKRRKKKTSSFQVNMRRVRLTAESRRELSKVKDQIWGNVANSIEGGDWWIMVRNYRYSHMKSQFERGMYTFFGLDKDVNVEIEDFDSNIIEYDDRIGGEL